MVSDRYHCAAQECVMSSFLFLYQHQTDTGEEGIRKKKNHNPLDYAVVYKIGIVTTQSRSKLLDVQRYVWQQQQQQQQQRQKRACGDRKLRRWSNSRSFERNYEKNKKKKKIHALRFLFATIQTGKFIRFVSIRIPGHYRNGRNTDRTNNFRGLIGNYLRSSIWECIYIYKKLCRWSVACAGRDIFTRALASY